MRPPLRDSWSATIIAARLRGEKVVVMSPTKESAEKLVAAIKEKLSKMGGE